MFQPDLVGRAQLACLRHLCLHLTGSVPEDTDVAPLSEACLDDLLSIPPRDTPQPPKP